MHFNLCIIPCFPTVPFQCTLCHMLCTLVNTNRADTLCRGTSRDYPTDAATQQRFKPPLRSTPAHVHACRFGTKERLVGDSEHAAWARRLLALRPHLQGPVYFLWGTDWEDAPAVNAGRLQAALPQELALDWPAFVRCASGGRPSIVELFAASPAAVKAGTAAAASGRSAPCLSPPPCMDSAVD